MLTGGCSRMAAHASTVYGTFAPEFAKQIPGADADPRFWASGISLIIHPWNPNVPAVHMNTRFVVTSKAWFGGGADLTPVLSAGARRKTPMRSRFTPPCAGPASGTRASRPMRNTRRGATNISSSSTATSRAASAASFTIISTARATARREARANLGWEADFAFTRDVGESFVAAYAESEQEFRDALDRGRPRGATRTPRPLCRIQPVLRSRHDFGLKTGGNVDSILSSMPPLVRWP